MSESSASEGPGVRAGVRVHPHHGPAPLAAIALGGAVGTVARYGMERAVVTPSDGFPWATLTVNLIGSFVLGIVMTLVQRRWPTDRFLRPLVAVGFCGGFTTFSTFAVEIDQRVRHGQVGLAFAYLAVSLLAGLGAAWGGIALARSRTTEGGAAAVVAQVPPDPDLLDGDDIGPGDRGGPP